MKTGDYRLGQWCPLCYRQYFLYADWGIFANRANTVEVHAEDTAEQKTESAAEEGSAESTASGTDNKDSSGSGENHTEQSTENTTENSTEGTTEETQPAAKCTCKEKCSQYAVNEDCEVCAKDYKECAYINPSVKSQSIHRLDGIMIPLR